MITPEDTFYAFFAGIASLVTAFVIVLLIAPGTFQQNPSILSIITIIAVEILVFIGVFLTIKHFAAS